MWRDGTWAKCSVAYANADCGTGASVASAATAASAPTASACTASSAATASAIAGQLNSRFGFSGL
jgi:hypothetical protein